MCLQYQTHCKEKRKLSLFSSRLCIYNISLSFSWDERMEGEATKGCKLIRFLSLHAPLPVLLLSNPGGQRCAAQRLNSQTQWGNNWYKQHLAAETLSVIQSDTVSPLPPVLFSQRAFSLIQKLFIHCSVSFLIPSFYLSLSWTFTFCLLPTRWSFLSQTFSSLLLSLLCTHFPTTVLMMMSLCCRASSLLCRIVCGLCKMCKNKPQHSFSSVSLTVSHGAEKQQVLPKNSQICSFETRKITSSPPRFNKTSGSGSAPGNRGANAATVRNHPRHIWSLFKTSWNERQSLMRSSNRLWLADWLLHTWAGTWTSVFVAVRTSWSCKKSNNDEQQ